MYNDWDNIDDFYDFDAFDESLEDIDFSEIRGKKDFKKSFSTANKKIERKKQEKKIVRKLPAQAQKRPVLVKRPVEKRPVQAQKPMEKRPATPLMKGKVAPPSKPKEAFKKQPQQGLPKRKTEATKPNQESKKPQQALPKRKQAVPVFKQAQIDRSEKKISRILVPDDKKVIVEGVSKFILSQKPDDKSIKNIGYYKGKKLQELVLIFNNTTPNPFTIELFNPSAPLDYLYNTSQNLNNKIEVAGGQVAYSDVLFNLLANPTLIPNCKFTFAGPSINAQKAIPLSIIDREISGEEFIQPLNIDLTIDNMQVQGDVTFFDISRMLNRPYIPDGMDTINYTVLPNMSVIMAFFYYQKSIKKAFFEEARQEKKLNKL